MAGFKVPYMLGKVNYVVFTFRKCTIQPVERIGVIRESPKVYKRRSLSEFGIARSTEVLGRRRIHITRRISGKGSSLSTSKVPMLEGIDYQEELKILKSRLDKSEKGNNLSRIMSDPNFLVFCWVKIRPNPESITPVFDGITMEWFENSAALMRKGGYDFALACRTYVSKSNKKLIPFTKPFPKDQIVQEGISFLLKFIYDPLFLNCSYARRPNCGFHSALKNIRMQCKTVSWYIKGDIKQQFFSIDQYSILVSLIKEKIDDQAFIDLIFKYINNLYEETFKSIRYSRINVILYSILADIYMHHFDEWIINDLKVRFDSERKRQKNKDYLKLYVKAGEKAFNKYLRSKVENDPNLKCLRYFRYADEFIIGVDGSKQDAIYLKDEIRKFLGERLKFTLNESNTLITHAETSKAFFFGYQIHSIPFVKMSIRRDKIKRKSSILSLNAPIENIIRKLIEKSYAKTNGKPTRNSRLINLELFQIIQHYKKVEKSIVNYYFLANNYERLLARVHFLLKYSCVLTIASKMRLKTMKGVFRKYGKNLSVKSKKGVITYPNSIL